MQCVQSTVHRHGRGNASCALARRGTRQDESTAQCTAQRGTSFSANQMRRCLIGCCGGVCGCVVRCACCAGSLPAMFGLDPAMYNVVMHGIAFMALFTAFQTSSGFSAIILKDEIGDDQLGFQSLATIYFVFAGTNMISPTVVHYAGMVSVADRLILVGRGFNL